MEYYDAGTIVYDNATVHVRRPILTDEERERRMKIIHDAAVDLLKDLYEKELRKNMENNKEGNKQKPTDNTKKKSADYSMEL